MAGPARTVDIPTQLPQENRPLSGGDNALAKPHGNEMATRIGQALKERAGQEHQAGDLTAALAHATSEELSPEPGVHRVSVKGATPVFRFDKVFPGGGVEEFDALTRLYSADPLHVAKPLQLNRDEQDMITGYDMEEVPGQTVDAYMESNGGQLDPNLAGQIRTALQTFHRNGLAHGDVNPHNIIINVTPNGERVIKFIDPAGYGKIAPQDLQQYIDFDQQRLAEWLPEKPE